MKCQEIQQTIQKGLLDTAKYQIVRGFGFQMQTTSNFERCLHRQRMEREVYSWPSEEEDNSKVPLPALKQGGIMLVARQQQWV